MWTKTTILDSTDYWIFSSPQEVLLESTESDYFMPCSMHRYIFTDGRAVAATAMYWGCRPVGGSDYPSTSTIVFLFRGWICWIDLAGVGYNGQPIRYKEKSTGDCWETLHFSHKGSELCSFFIFEYKHDDWSCSSHLANKRQMQKDEGQKTQFNRKGRQKKPAIVKA